MVRDLGICLAALCLGSCQMGPAVPIGAAFDPRSAEHILKSGRGRIDGQAFLKRDYGRLVTAAGEIKTRQK